MKLWKQPRALDLQKGIAPLAPLSRPFFRESKRTDELYGPQRSGPFLWWIEAIQRCLAVLEHVGAPSGDGRFREVEILYSRVVSLEYAHERIREVGTQSFPSHRLQKTLGIGWKPSYSGTVFFDLRRSLV